MAQHNIELIGTFFLFILGVCIIYQGHLIYHGKYGYRHCEREKRKTEDTRRLLEKLLKNK